MIDPISPCHRMIPRTKVNRNPRKNSCQSDIRRSFHHRSIAYRNVNANDCRMVSLPKTQSNWVPARGTLCETEQFRGHSAKSLTALERVLPLEGAARMVS